MNEIQNEIIKSVAAKAVNDTLYKNNKITHDMYSNAEKYFTDKITNLRKELGAFE